MRKPDRAAADHLRRYHPKLPPVRRIAPYVAHNELRTVQWASTRAGPSPLRPGMLGKRRAPRRPDEAGPRGSGPLKITD